MNFQFGNNGLSFGQLNEMMERYYAPAGDETSAAQAAWKNVARCQLELWALANRRARATLALPTTLAASPSPMGLMAVYADFWQTAFKECADTTHRMTELLTEPKSQESSEAETTPPKMAQPKVIRTELNGRGNRWDYDGARGGDLRAP